MMAEKTTPTSDEANVSTDDAIADILAGTDEEETDTNDTEASEDTTEEETEESTDVDESNEEADETEPDSDEEDTTWAGVLGVDDSNIILDDNGDFKGVNVKVDGKTSTVDMKSLIAGFQTDKHNTNKSQKLAVERTEFEGIRDSAVESYTKKLNEVSQLAEYMHKTLLGEYENLDWNTLRVQDPAEYAAAMQDYQKRDNDIRGVYSTIQQEQASATNTQTQQSDIERNKHNLIELDKVRTNNPQWADDTALKNAFVEMGTFVDETYGLPAELFDQLNDARYVEIVKDAMTYRKGKKQVNNKLVKKLPKYQKSKGSSGKQKISKLDKLTKAAKNATGSSKRDLETSAIAELLSG